MPEKQPLKLYLAGWQKRMLADYMPGPSCRGIRIKDINAVILKPGAVRCPASYKIPPEGIRKGDWVMHLTDEQMNIAAKYLGGRIRVSSFNISPDFLNSGEISFVR